MPWYIYASLHTQVDILVSDDSLASCPTMYNRGFTWVETRAKSELRVKLVPFNMLKLSSYSFTGADFVDRRFKCLKPGPYPVLCVCVWWGGGGSRRYNHSNIYHDPAIGYSITCVDRPRYWRVGQGLQMHFTLTTRVGICVR